VLTYFVGVLASLCPKMWRCTNHLLQKGTVLGIYGKDNKAADDFTNQAPESAENHRNRGSQRKKTSAAFEWCGK
jgi:hypothetical protein